LEERSFRQNIFGDKTQIQLGKVGHRILFTETLGVDAVNTVLCFAAVTRMWKHADSDDERL